MKSILCITENLGSGGAERQLTGLAVMLKEAGYKVKFVTYIKKQFYEPYLRDNGVDYELIPNGQNKLSRLNSIRKVLNEFSPDAVISFLPSVNLTMCLFKVLGYRFRLIVSERSHTNNLTAKQRLTFGLYRFADYVVANSYSETENIGRLAPSLKPKLRTITNFVDTDKFCPSQNNKEYDDTINILSVGRVIPVKNILNYIRAVKFVVDSGCNINVTWVGDNYDKDYYKQCIDLIHNLDLENHFIFKPQTENVVKEYQKADIFCLPSFYEGFPNVICEAMSCGLPIVCSNVCENPYIVENGVNGFLFEPDNIMDIVGKISLLMDDGIRLTIGERNILKTKTCFTREFFINNYINLIQDESNLLN